MDDRKSPMRAFRLTLRIDADTRDELANALRTIADHVDRDEISVGMSGGPSSGWIHELLHDPAQTHETYFAQVREYLKDKGHG